MTVVAGIVFVINTATPLQAAPPTADPIAEQVEQFAKHARQAYNLQDFDRAIAYYLRAYRLSPNGALLYNIAYIYDHKLSEVDTAMEFYRRYIRSEDADPDVVQRSTTRLQELKVLKRNTVRKEQRIIPPLDTGPSPGPGRIAPQRDNGPPHQYKPRSTQSIWGWSLVGVGGASLTGALVLGLVAGKTHDDFNSASSPSRKQSLQDTGKQQTLVADILLVAGGVAATTGLIMLLTDNDRPKSSSAGVNWGLSGNTNSAFLHLGGRF